MARRDASVVPFERACVVAFQARGDSDASLFFTSCPGGSQARRWQDLALRDDSVRVDPFDALEPGALAPHLEQAPHYLVVVGTHRNAGVKVERSGVEVVNTPWAQDDRGVSVRLSRAEFRPYWVALGVGGVAVTVGTGDPLGPVSGRAILCQWRDPRPLTGLGHLSFAAWDSHVAFRGLRVVPLDDAAAARLAATPVIAPVAAAGVGQDGDAPLPLFPEPRPGPPLLEEVAARAVLDGLSPTTACIAASTAASLGLGRVCAAAVDYVAAHLARVVRDDPVGWRALPQEILLAVLRSERLTCEGEVDVFRGVALWSWGESHAETSVACPRWIRPEESVNAALELVRFPFMEDALLSDLARSTLFVQCPTLRCLVTEALQQVMTEDWATASDLSVISEAVAHHGALLSPDDDRVDTASGAELAALRRTRRLRGGVDLVYVHDGDQNGIISFLGTGGGTGAFVNPALTSLVQVTVSSPETKTTCCSMLTSRRSGCAMNWAGSLGGSGAVGEAAGAWWALDLGPTVRLACNHYTLRSDDSGSWAPYWELQGSNDGAHWTTLARHADKLPSRKQQFISLPVDSRGARVAHRRFRLWSHRPAEEDGLGAAVHLHLTWIELYGHAISVPSDAA